MVKKDMRRLNRPACVKVEGFDFDICYTSYLKRAVHTLQHILMKWIAFGCLL
ncbi:MAG: hypothetical protein ACLT16_10570 [[Clostridium] innocuum]